MRFPKSRRAPRTAAVRGFDFSREVPSPGDRTLDLVSDGSKPPTAWFNRVLGPTARRGGTIVAICIYEAGLVPPRRLRSLRTVFDYRSPRAARPSIPLPESSLPRQGRGSPVAGAGSLEGRCLWRGRFWCSLSPPEAANPPARDSRDARACYGGDRLPNNSHAAVSLPQRRLAARGVHAVKQATRAAAQRATRKDPVISRTHTDQLPVSTQLPRRLRSPGPSPHPHLSLSGPEATAPASAAPPKPEDRRLSNLDRARPVPCRWHDRNARHPVNGASSGTKRRAAAASRVVVAFNAPGRTRRGTEGSRAPSGAGFPNRVADFERSASAGVRASGT